MDREHSAPEPSAQQSTPHEPAVKETVTEVRQGVTGHHVRYVLLVSCALAIALLAVVFLMVGGGS